MKKARKYSQREARAQPVDNFDASERTCRLLLSKRHDLDGSLSLNGDIWILHPTRTITNKRLMRLLDKGDGNDGSIHQKSNRIAITTPRRSRFVENGEIKSVKLVARFT